MHSFLPYQQIKDGTLKIAQTPAVNELFSLAQGPKGLLAGSLDHSWNQILPDLILFSDRLEALGFRVINGEVVITDGNDA